MEAFYMCSNCKHCNREPGTCEACKMPLAPDGNLFNVKDGNAQPPNKCVTIPKRNFYGEKTLQQSNPSNEAALQNSHIQQPVKVFVTSESPVPKRHCSVAISKAVPEPECLTISSDKDGSRAPTSAATPYPVVPHAPPPPPAVTSVSTNVAPAPVSPIVPGVQVSTKVPQPPSTETQDTSTTTTNTHRVVSTGVLRGPVKLCLARRKTSDTRWSYGSTTVFDESPENLKDFGPALIMNSSEEEVEEEEERNEELEQFEEQEEMEEHEADEEHESEGSDGNMGIPIWCRSIRIGSFKVHPSNSSFLPVFIKGDGFVFSVPTVADENEMVKIRLRPVDIVHTLGHFGRCLPILFVYTNQDCGAFIRNKLRMSKRDGPYFDPAAKDERQKRITFLIEILTDEHRVFLRHVFPGEGLLQEIDQKTATEILKRSTPTPA